MNVTIEIDELVLHGFAAGDRYRIGEAVQAELARLIAERGLPEAANPNGPGVEVARLDGGAFAVPPGAPAAAVAAGIAAAVYRSMTAVPGGQEEVR